MRRERRPPTAAGRLEGDEEVRRYAYERDLVLLEDQLSFGEVPAPYFGEL